MAWRLLVDKDEAHLVAYRAGVEDAEAARSRRRLERVSEWLLRNWRRLSR